MRRRSEHTVPGRWSPNMTHQSRPALAQPRAPPQPIGFGGSASGCGASTYGGVWSGFGAGIGVTVGETRKDRRAVARCRTTRHHAAVLRGEGLDRATVGHIEKLAAAAWPAETRELRGGWTLRASPGLKTRRANSVLPVPGSGTSNAHAGSADLPSADLDTALADCADFYRSRGLPLIFQLSPAVAPPNLEEELDRRGFRAEATTDVLVADAANVVDHLSAVRPGRRRLGPRAVPSTSSWSRASPRLGSKPSPPSRDAPRTRAPPGRSSIASRAPRVMRAPSAIARRRRSRSASARAVGPVCSASRLTRATAGKAPPHRCCVNSPAGASRQERGPCTCRSPWKTNPPSGCTARRDSDRPIAITTGWAERGPGCRCQPRWPRPGCVVSYAGWPSAPGSQP